jgi:type IV secretory pathway component VirB8
MGALGGTAPFYEKDGTLRAYANRVLVLAAILALVVAVEGAIILVTRTKPPVIIRIGPDGQATVVSPAGTATNSALLKDAKTSPLPSDNEKKFVVTTFVTSWWGYDEHTLADHWSQAMNMMTRNLRTEVLKKITDENSVSTIESSHGKSVVSITSMDQDPNDPLTFHVLATRTETHATDGKTYSGSKMAESYTIHLVETDRTPRDPSGLLVASFKRDVISTEPYNLEQ